MQAVVIGAGAVGARCARQLFNLEMFDRVRVVDIDPQRAAAVAESLGGDVLTSAVLEADWLAPGDAVVLAGPAGASCHVDPARVALSRQADVVSVSDSIEDVRALLDLDGEARRAGRNVVVGAGFSPGLGCLLAAHGASGFDAVDEVHVAKVGTGGPACARQHHRAVGGRGVDWRDGEWTGRRGGSGRELCWFPDPVGAVDCYRAALADALLLVPAFPDARRVTARVGASRRDRFTSAFPMLRSPHPEGALGALRVEVRGRRGVAREDCVLGAVDRPAVAAAAVSTLACQWAATANFRRTGAAGLAELVEAAPFLSALAEQGVKAAIFEGQR